MAFNRYSPIKSPMMLEFNPHDKEHLMAFVELNFGTSKQYKNYRFDFDETKFGDVLSFMRDKVIRAFIKDVSDSQNENSLMERVIEKDEELVNKTKRIMSDTVQKPGVRYPSWIQ